jgi:outer membrane lipoprotein-sorting protein
MQKRVSDTRGFGHIVVIAVVSLVVVVGIGGWLVYNTKKAPSNANTEAVRKALREATCDRDDTDICKFFISWKASRYVTANTTTKVGNTTNTSTIEIDDKNYHSKINAELIQESIVIGNAIYYKDAQKNKWYKQELTQPGTTGFTFDKSDLQREGGAFTYKKVGKETCGELTCFKYEVSNAENKDLKQYIWFDDQDYQLRKQTTEQKDPPIFTTTTFSYEKVTITEPSPFTELRNNEYYIPGQGVVDPSTLPSGSTEELNKLIEQFSQ